MQLRLIPESRFTKFSEFPGELSSSPIFSTRDRINGWRSKSNKKKFGMKMPVRGWQLSKIVLTRDTESNFLRACRIEKSENIGVGWPTGVYDRARTGHVPGAMYLDESHGNSARARARARIHESLHARTCVSQRESHACIYMCDCVYVRVLAPRPTSARSFRPHVPRDKARQGEITRGEQIHTYARELRWWRDGWNARGKNRDGERGGRG